MSIATRVENLLKGDFTFDGVIESDGSVVIVGIKSGVKAGSMASTHGGFAGKSLSQLVCDDLDEAIRMWKEHSNCDTFMESCEICRDKRELEMLAQGLAHALGILWGTSCETEWQNAVHRFESGPAEGQS